MLLVAGLLISLFRRTIAVSLQRRRSVLSRRKTNAVVVVTDLRIALYTGGRRLQPPSLLSTPNLGQPDERSRIRTIANTRSSGRQFIEPRFAAANVYPRDARCRASFSQVRADIY